MKRILIDKSISDRVLTVGERYWDPVHGGIVSVLNAYRESFETFPFIASSGRLNWAHKLWYDLGGLFALGWRLLWDRRIKIVHIHTAAGRSFDKHAYYAWLARLMGRKVILHSLHLASRYGMRGFRSAISGGCGGCFPSWTASSSCHRPGAISSCRSASPRRR